MDKIRVAVMGLGSWGECHLEAFHALKQVEITAICSLQEDVVQRLGEKYQIDGRYTDAERLWERNDIDLVSIVTFENEHYVPTIKALESGKHVLVEKPITTKLHEAEEMWATAERCGRLIVPGHILRFDPNYAEIHDAIHSDRVGKPVSIYLKRNRPSLLFKLYQRIHTVFESTIHDLDVAIWYAESTVKSVKAYSRSVSGSAIPDMVWSCVEFHNGVLAVIESNWLIPSQANIAMTDAIEVVGEKGIARFETSHSGVQIWNEAGRHNVALNIHNKQGGRISGALREQLSYICDCIIRKEKPAYISFPDAVEGIRTAEAILRSLETGKEVYL